MRFLIAILLVLVPCGATAFEIQGRIVNGTTNQPVSDAKISVVNPSGGMLVEEVIEALDERGNFTVNDLDEQTPIYLLRVSYAGVNYTEIIRYDGSDPSTIEMTVYETTPSWDGVHVSIPHMMITRSLDTLTVDKFIQVTNLSSPPRTVIGPQSRFVVYLPDDMLELNGLSVRSVGVPLPVTPVPTEDPGFYAIDYPIKPGETVIQLSFDLPYASSEYTYTEPLRYDIEELLIVTQDPSIEVASATVDIGAPQDSHGFKSYLLTDVASDKPLSLVFRGGAAVAAGSGPEIMIVPNATRNTAIAVMIALALMLVGFLITVVARGHSPAVETEVLEIQKEELLSQMARLDDLHQTGTVSDQMYKLKRSELMNALAGIYYRTTFDPPTEKSSDETSERGAARV